MKEYAISNKQTLTFETIADILNNHATLTLSSEAVSAINKCRHYLDQKMENATVPVYGVTTGFGSLCNRNISKQDLGQLQKNLMMSHACGMGEEVPESVVRLMLLLKIQNMSYGNSGVQLCTVQRLVDFFNNDILPVVYRQGSLGASGDLVPLAHLCLPLIGLGEVNYKGKKYSGEEINRQFGWQPIELQSKEGLALLNGTQFMSSYATYLVMKAKRLARQADMVAALSFEAFDGRIEPFNDLVHQVRPHNGQIETAAFFRTFLQGSQIVNQPKQHVQDPYSFRCIPQVHGASKDAINHVSSVVTTEINSVTDNPTVFPDEDLIISAGNFHGQPLALVLDFLSIAMSELGNISERRTYQLIAGKRDLPSFLVANPGLNSGFMIPQYAAAALVNQNKTLTMPASTDSIESSQGQEDHVSMGANAATKAFRIAENLEKILAIELFNAAQAFAFRRPLRSSDKVEKMYEDYRRAVPFVENDLVMYEQIHKSIAFLQNMQLD